MSNKDSSVLRPEERVLLSEFDCPGLKWTQISTSRRAIKWMSVGCFVWAASMMWLGDRLQTNASGLELSAKFSNRFGLGVTGKFPVIYGWMAQINEGPFYLLMGPLLLVLAYRFLLAGGHALERLAQSGRLKTLGTCDGWMQVVARRNRWCVVPIFLFPIILVLVLFVQLSSIDRTSRGYPTTQPRALFPIFGSETHWKEIGYIQSLNFTVWTNAFEKAPAEVKIGILRRHDKLNPLEANLFSALDSANALTNESLQKYLTFAEGKPKAIRLEPAVQAGDIELHASILWPGIEPVSWLGFQTYFSRLIKGREVLSPERPQFVWWFKLFIILTQIQIAFFFTFMAWLLWKIAFWFMLIYRLLPSGNGQNKKSVLSLAPILRDPQGRYGLGELFRPYNLLVLVVAVGASFSALHFPDGAGVRAITDAEGAGLGATRFTHLFAISGALAAVLIGPLYLYPMKLQSWAESTRLQRLRAELSTAVKPKHVTALLEEEAQILNQSSWPRGDNSFRVTLLVVLVVLLLPIGSAFQFLPGDVTPFTRLPQALRSTCKEFAARVYSIMPE